MDNTDDWNTMVMPPGHLLFPMERDDRDEGEGEPLNPFSSASYEPPMKGQAVAINNEVGKQFKPVLGNPQSLRERKPEIRVLHADNHPFPQFWIKKNTLRPSVILTLHNCEGYNMNSLTVMAVAMDPTTRQPISTAKLTNDSVGIDEELSVELKQPSVRFSELKIYGDRSLGGKRGNDVQLAFCVYNKLSFPPTPLCYVLDANPIAVFNRFDELPAPNIYKVIPNRVVCRQQTNITVIGQFFKESKGKQSRQTKTVCGVTLRNDLDIYPNSLEEMFPLLGPPQYTYTVKNADTHTFSMPFCCSDAGFVLLNASNDGKNFGLGKLVEVQREPQTYRQGETITAGNASPSNVGSSKKREIGGNQPKSSGYSSPTMDVDTASYYGNFSQLQLLLSQGCSINHKDGQGNSPLAMTSMKGYTGCTDLLLRNGAKPNSLDKMNETPLHHASRQGHSAIVKSLLLYGAHVDIQNQEGCVPLHLAAASGHLEIVNMLINKMEEIDIVDNDDLLPTHYAVMGNHSAVLKCLAKEFVDRELSLDTKDSMGFTALHWAVKLGSQENVLILIENGADLNKKDSEKETALFLAVRNSDERIVQSLLEAGARTDIKNDQGQTVHDICENEDIRSLLSTPIHVHLARPSQVSTNVGINISSEKNEMDKLKRDLEQLKLENLKLSSENKQLQQRSSPANSDRETDPSPELNITKTVPTKYQGDNDYLAQEWWKSNFEESATIDDFIGTLLRSFPSNLSSLDDKYCQIGVKDYFDHVAVKKTITLQHLEQFLKLYGPIDGMQQRVANVYKLDCFHGFISNEEAASQLKGQVGSFLFRYPQSLLDRGCFILNVNRGQKKGFKNTEQIENYVVNWHPQSATPSFSFYKQNYETLSAFVEDPTYANILVEAVSNNNKFRV